MYLTHEQQITKIEIENKIKEVAEAYNIFILVRKWKCPKSK